MSAAARLQVELRGAIGAFGIDARLDVPAQGVTAIFGPSGAGKTSLLRAISGLERLSGRVSVDGRTWQDDHTFVPAWKRRVGLVFQDQALFPHLDVRGNLDFAIRRAGPGAIGFDETVALLRLEPLLGRKVHQLSGGEGRLAALARALLSQPALLLLDEPLAGLDLAAKAQVLDLLERTTQRLAIPTLLVSHDPAEIARLADRVLLMAEGRVTVSDVAPQALAQPLGAEAAAHLLAGQTSDRLARLALAALMAGLEPASVDRT